MAGIYVQSACLITNGSLVPRKQIISLYGGETRRRGRQSYEYHEKCVGERMAGVHIDIDFFGKAQKP